MKFERSTIIEAEKKKMFSTITIRTVQEARSPFTNAYSWMILQIEAGFSAPTRVEVIKRSRMGRYEKRRWKEWDFMCLVNRRKRNRSS